MSIRRLLKSIEIFFILFIIIALVVSLSVSHDEHHLETCQNDHCIYCLIIHFAQNIINLTICLIISVMIGFLVYFFLSRLHREKIIFMQSSLVFQKVQLNE